MWQTLKRRVKRLKGNIFNMNKEIFQKRRDNLRIKMKNHGIDALLVSYAPNRYYLSGFESHDGQCNESSGYLIITENGQDLLCTDSRFELAATEVWDSNNVIIYKQGKDNFYNDLFKKKGFKTLGFDEECLTYSFIQKAFDGVNVKESFGLIEELRVIKDENEIACMKESAKLNHALMEHLPTYLKENVHKNITEKDVAWYIESYFRNNGATGNAFSPIVALNQHAALPHCIPDDTVITENSLLMVDVGATLKDYNSDQTRTFWIGDTPSDRFKTVLEQVQGAQQAALDILRAGITGKQAHEEALKYFVQRGVEKYFTHGLGHGVGLETHEAPRLALYNDKPLEAGMIVTVEPGLYYPEWGGIRWEYMALITENGCEIL